MTTLFENGIVVTLGKPNRVIVNGSVLISGEKIESVGERGES